MRVIVGSVLGALVAAGIGVAPAFGAPDANPRAKRFAARAPRDIIGAAFTPAAADPRLAAALARAGLGSGGFRFTPAEARREGTRAITVAVRARSVGASPRVASAAPDSVSLAPIAYSLGAAVGWKRFALSGDLTKLDLAGQPGSREAVDVGVSYTGTRASARVRASAQRPIEGMPRLIADSAAYSLDVGGSYSLTRNLDVTAGVRYKADRDRLERVRDDRRDSQAVYVGTAFRF